MHLSSLTLSSLPLVFCFSHFCYSPSLCPLQLDLWPRDQTFFIVFRIQLLGDLTQYHDFPIHVYNGFPQMCHFNWKLLPNSNIQWHKNIIYIIKSLIVFPKSGLLPFPFHLIQLVLLSRLKIWGPSLILILSLRPFPFSPSLPPSSHHSPISAPTYSASSNTIILFSKNFHKPAWAQCFGSMIS